MSLVARVIGLKEQLVDSITPTPFAKFNAAAPSDQAAIDLFKDHWASLLPDTRGPLSAGSAPVFTDDPRPAFAARALGGAPLEGARILELGPLEGGHTYQLEKLGAEVIAVEGNAEAYLKCLIVKEIYQLKSRFLFGDFKKYLKESTETYDLIHASGVLYHMAEPLALIRSICAHAPRSFVWTHYYDKSRCKGFRRQDKVEHGFAAPHYRRNYAFRGYRRFWGGLAGHACWLERESIFAAFRAFGHEFIEVVEESADHPAGPAFSFITSAEPL